MNLLRTYRLAGRVIFMTVFFIFICMGVRAQSDSTKRPSLGEHVFTPVTNSNLPFINTYFSTLTGFGQTLNLTHQIDLPDNIQFGGLAGEVTFIDMGFAYQQRVRDWLAAYITLNVSARLGTQLQSILAQGFSTISSFKIGWHIKLAEGNKFALSTIVELQNNQGSLVSVLGFIKDVINDHPNPSITRNVPVLAAVTGIRFAYGLNNLVGFKVSSDLAYGETYTPGKNGFAFSGSAGIDLDFYPRYSLPVGFVLNYSMTSMPDFVLIDGKKARMIRGKIAYTKATDFSLGIEFSYMKVPMINMDEPPSVASFALVARYYF